MGSAIAAAIAPVLLDCGHMSAPDGFVTGYAHGPAGTLCYPCADDAQRRDIETVSAFLAYDHDDETRRGTIARGHVTTWTGGYLATVIRRSTNRNSRTGSRMTALTVRTPGGRILTGRYGSDWSQAVILRPTKRTTR